MVRQQKGEHSVTNWSCNNYFCSLFKILSLLPLTGATINSTHLQHKTPTYYCIHSNFPGSYILMVLYYASHIYFTDTTWKGIWNNIVGILTIKGYMIQRNRVLYALAIIYPDKEKSWSFMSLINYPIHIKIGSSNWSMGGPLCMQVWWK